MSDRIEEQGSGTQQQGTFSFLDGNIREINSTGYRDFLSQFQKEGQDRNLNLNGSGYMLERLGSLEAHPGNRSYHDSLCPMFRNNSLFPESSTLYPQQSAGALPPYHKLVEDTKQKYSTAACIYMKNVLYPPSGQGVMTFSDTQLFNGCMTQTMEFTWFVKQAAEAIQSTQKSIDEQFLKHNSLVKFAQEVIENELYVIKTQLVYLILYFWYTLIYKPSLKANQGTIDLLNNLDDKITPETVIEQNWSTLFYSSRTKFITFRDVHHERLRNLEEIIEPFKDFILSLANSVYLHFPDAVESSPIHQSLELSSSRSNLGLSNPNSIFYFVSSQDEAFSLDQLYECDVLNPLSRSQTNDALAFEANTQKVDPATATGYEAQNKV